MSGADPSPTNPRLAEVVAALSLATDLGTGHPLERSLRSCLLALQLGRCLGLTEAELRDLYYVALLRWVGCTASDHRAQLFGDEIALGVEIDAVELWQALPMLGFVLRRAGAGQPPLPRLRTVLRGLTTGVQRSMVAAVTHCEVAQQVAARLGLPSTVAQALGQIFERWDGRGVPGRARGEGLLLATRIAQLAQDVELFHRLGGHQAAVQIARERAGGLYDPVVVATFDRHAPMLLASLNADSVWAAVLAVEPGESITLGDDRLAAALEAIADFTDLRSAYTVGHSRAVAQLVTAAARHQGWPAGDVELVRRAALVHDVGMTGISLSLWEKPAALTEGEWERVRLHPYYTERILARPHGLARLGVLAALHHERLDGSGYHRGLPATLLPPLARLLAAAEVYQSLIEPRAYRAAQSPDHAARALQQAVRAGTLDGPTVSALLAAVGHRPAPGQRVHQVAGLSRREVEVLRLLTRGESNRRIAQQLAISPATVDHHVRHIYTKIGVSTRAAATLFALQHQLIVDASDV